MPSATRTVSIAGLLLACIPLLRTNLGTAAAQAPTLPSDTLEANFGPRSELAPNPELAPSLPSDTIKIGAPLDTTGLVLPAAPERPKAKRKAGDSTAKREAGDSTSEP
jgi:hypothetical protein